jgi:hypothetical protein
MEKVDISYDHLVFITAIGNILWPIGIFCGNLVYFSPFWYFGPRKIWHLWCMYVSKKVHFQFRENANCQKSDRTGKIISKIDDSASG